MITNALSCRRAFSVTRKSLIVFAFLTGASVAAFSQTCQTGQEIDSSTRTVIETSARRIFDLVQRGDSATLKSSSIPSVTADFGGIEQAVRDNQNALAGAQPAVRNSYLLAAEGNTTIERAEFLCGVFAKQGQTESSAVFVLINLPPGTYAVVIEDVASNQAPYTVSEILQQTGNDWKLGGLYIKPTQIAGHDSAWFAEKARAYKSKGQLYNGWFYLLTARDLASPVPFMSTLQTDRLYDEAHKGAPPDLPGEKPLQLVTPQKTYNIKAMFPFGVAQEVNLVVKYESPDVSNTAQAFTDNEAVAKALVAKLPELRDAFGAIVARATEPSGRDYGTLVAMKDIK